MSDLDAFVDGEGARFIRKMCSSALSPSRLPGLDHALNPYARCGHDCTYCYAPYVMRTSPLEWGGGIVAKVNIPQVLAKELPRRQGVIGLGTVTDPYQPVEEEALLTRRCLEEIAKADVRVSVLTKSDLVLRDRDLLKRMRGAEVGITINTISDARASIFETNAPPPSRRLRAARCLVEEGVSTYVFLGPIIPTITDLDIEGLAQGIASSGVRSVMIDRLNLRPGMKDRMCKRMAQRSPSTLAQFEALVVSDAYYLETIAILRKVLKEAGVRTTAAF
jgi:DNA repair photolyase